MMNKHALDNLIRLALKEDAVTRDITSQLLIAPKQLSKGHIVARERGVVCGLLIVKAVFQKVSRQIAFHPTFKDGMTVRKNEKVATFKGPTRKLLAAERTALNFLSHCSGIATTARRYRDKLRLSRAKVLDTRKTTPGLRSLEKYAVRCGGGFNHRMDLGGHIMIKDNHRQACAMSIPRAIKTARRRSRKTLEIEVDNLAQFKLALEAGPDIILLDNMTCAQMKRAARLLKAIPRARRPLLEASGGITLENIAAVAKTGVDRISVGALTQSGRPINFSMEFVN